MFSTPMSSSSYVNLVDNSHITKQGPTADLGHRNTQDVISAGTSIII